MDHQTCMWIMGVLGGVITYLALYIARQWKERRDEYVAELKALRKVLNKGDDE